MRAGGLLVYSFQGCAICCPGQGHRMSQCTLGEKVCVHVCMHVFHPHQLAKTQPAFSVTLSPGDRSSDQLRGYRESDTFHSFLFHLLLSVLSPSLLLSSFTEMCVREWSALHLCILLQHSHVQNPSICKMKRIYIGTRRHIHCVAAQLTFIYFSAFVLDCRVDR